MGGNKKMVISQYCIYHKETKLVPRVVGVPISMNAHTAYSDEEWKKFVELEHEQNALKADNKDKVILVCPEEKCGYGEDFKGEVR